MDEISAFGVVHKSFKVGFPGSKDEDFIPVTQMSPEDRKANLEALRGRRFYSQNPDKYMTSYGRPISERPSILRGKSTVNQEKLAWVKRQARKHRTAYRRVGDGQKTSPVRTPVPMYNKTLDEHLGYSITHPADPDPRVNVRFGISRDRQARDIKEIRRMKEQRAKYQTPSPQPQAAKAAKATRSGKGKWAVGGAGVLALGGAGAYAANRKRRHG